MPQGFRLDRNRKYGTVVWNPDAVGLYTSPNQTKSNAWKGRFLIQEMLRKQVMNACVRDYLLDNQDLIPEDWKSKKSICFWGTTLFMGDTQSRCVPNISHDGSTWNMGYSELSELIDPDSPGAIFLF
jgi:hypothetical protein